jgi:hypothetical protein
VSAAPHRAEAGARDFWLSCGHHLLDRSEGGGLVVTDAFLKAYLARPELAPPPEACAVERTLHAALLAEPRRPVDPAIVAEIADADARDNWRAMLAFRDRLLAHPTLEAAYVDLVRHGGGTPPLFLDQLVHAILRNALDRCGDPFMLRAAEIFFRPQRLTLRDESLIAADEEIIESASGRTVSPLVALLGLDPAAQIDVMVEENAATYWQRSDRFDMALDLTPGRRGLAALGEVIAAWIAHLLALDVAVEPVGDAKELELAWYVGLDAQGTRIGDALWKGEPPDEAGASRIAGLYRLIIRDDDRVAESAKGEPVHLIMAMPQDMKLRLKPQNLLTGLPLRRLEGVS